MTKITDLSNLFQRYEPSAQLIRQTSLSFPSYTSNQALFDTDVCTLNSSMPQYPVYDIQQLSCYTLFRTICYLPSSVRTWWTDECTRGQKLRLSQFIENRVRKPLISKEIALIQYTSNTKQLWSKDELNIKGSIQTGEIIASYTKDEATVEIKIKLPKSYPLKNVEVECTSRLGVSEQRWRRWVLQIVQLLSTKDGSVVDAILLWKNNIARELSGVEPCPICYCVLHIKTLTVPILKCPTCNNKFHSECLHTWFKSGGGKQNKCVLCQQPFYLPSSGIHTSSTGGGVYDMNNNGNGAGNWGAGGGDWDGV